MSVRKHWLFAVNMMFVGAFMCAFETCYWLSTGRHLAAGAALSWLLATLVYYDSAAIVANRISAIEDCDA